MSSVPTARAYEFRIGAITCMLVALCNVEEAFAFLLEHAVCDPIKLKPVHRSTYSFVQLIMTARFPNINPCARCRSGHMWNIRFWDFLIIFFFFAWRTAWYATQRRVVSQLLTHISSWENIVVLLWKRVSASICCSIIDSGTLTIAFSMHKRAEAAFYHAQTTVFSLLLRIGLSAVPHCMGIFQMLKSFILSVFDVWFRCP